MIPLNVAAQVQVVLLVIAAVLAGVAALLGVLHLVLGAGWWRFRRPARAAGDERTRDNDEDPV